MIIERISENHLRKISDFQCEEEEMEDFLKSEAYKYDVEGEGNTYIVLENNKILGYYTLKCNALQVLEDGNKYNPYKVLPCVEVARLAVDMNCRHKGIGSTILSYIFTEVMKLKENIGIKYIFLFSIPSAENFYENKNRTGFKFREFPKNVHFLTDSSCAGYADEYKPLYINTDEFKED